MSSVNGEDRIFFFFVELIREEKGAPSVLGNGMQG